MLCEAQVGVLLPHTPLSSLGQEILLLPSTRDYNFYPKYFYAKLGIISEFHMAPGTMSDAQKALGETIGF